MERTRKTKRRQKPKRRRLASNGDRISKLHESVIGNVLSRLPTRYAVRTSILSRDWKHKWTSLYNVDIDDRRYGRRNEPLQKVMSKILMSCGYLKIIRLISLEHIGSKDQKWISHVLRLELECFEVDLKPGLGLFFPCSLLNSIWLRKLSICHQGTLCVSVMNCVPNLTILHLALLEIVNEDPNSNTTTFDFPVLKTLRFSRCKWLNVKSMELLAPSLTTFTCYSLEPSRDYDYSIYIDAPKLTTFSCVDGLLEKFVLNASSCVSVFLLQSRCLTRDLELLNTIRLRARNLVNTFPSLMKLELSSFMAEAFILGPPLCHYDKLIRLGLFEPSVKQILELLHAMPSLKFLSVTVTNLEDYDYEKMQCVPTCIAYHLEEVEFRSFDRQVPAYNLAKFLYETAEQLKKFIIVGNKKIHQQQIEDVLSTFPTYSPSPAVEFRGSY